MELTGTTTMSNIKPIDRVIIKTAKYINGYKGIGRTENWHLKQLGWMRFQQLNKYCVAKYFL